MVLLRDLGMRNVIGILVDAVDYEAAIDRIITAATEHRGYAVSALAVHGVMTGVRDPEHAYRLNHFDLVTPDGQPVRWALNLLHGTGLTDRVYGPRLMLGVCGAAAARRLPIYLYGSTEPVLDRLKASLRRRFPALLIAGTEPSKFRRTTPEEKAEIVERITSSGTAITFVGLGCPRQEVFAYEYRHDLSMPVVAVGAAFDYHAGVLREPSYFIQRAGLHWLYRLAQEPHRLWKRYTVLNASYLGRLALQRLGFDRPDPNLAEPPRSEALYG
jgi:N-acetylglucosaminyldiphosphoundecaprenol N-acetyl-beta-D-mannosaminyltransferase